ncbi:uncharacterized protein TNCV_2013061 [Trichonephila clavipes]|nr:uncharacterized protein TNCV_2013061 [Trichonephila clavipes]
MLLVHILRDSPNNVFKDMTSYHGLPGHQRSFANRACSGCAGKATAAYFAAWGTLNSRRAASLIVRFVVGDERWKAPDHPQGVLLLNLGETELNRSVICMVLKATANDKRHLTLCHDEFRGP